MKSRNPAFLLEKHRLVNALALATVTKYHRLRGLTTDIHLSLFRRLGRLRLGRQNGQVLVRTLLLADGRPPSCCVLM